MLLAFEVLQAAGRGDEDIDAARKGANLRRKADAAENRGVRELEELAVGAEALRDLRGEFAGRGEDKRAGTLRRGRCGIRGEPLQDGQRERGGLARAGLRHADQVAALQKERNGLRLDGRGNGVVLFAEGAQKRLGEREIGEVDGGRRLPESGWARWV